MSQPRFLMCSPQYFGVEYVINPWMNGQIHGTNYQLVTSQWSTLQTILKQYADVSLLPGIQGLPDLVFTANAAIIYRQTALVSSFRYPQRQPETQHFAEWLTADGFKVHTLPRDVLFEGAGDALFDRKEPLLWFGYGLRSDAAAKPYLEKFIGTEVQPLELCDPCFYHLDTCFCPLEDGYLLYYPGAFTKESRTAIETRVPAGQRLAVSREDAGQFACNAVNIGKQVVLNQSSREMTRWLSERGFTVIETPLTEFMKSGGAAKCLSLRLDEHRF
ncbi:MAG: nitrate reductase [Acidobacteriaceae bacterium]|nr:nitrate reductase [Acidobacteriaceae bacterium]MBV9033059.1 nitrate reductase [Acidobacteriaceae bacterium]MBV9222391.1 nitrate reductase [Acidobacteriaceae bacterium]MBV9307029.1 nitrate reductase [Acidobacteriaceae bacterium]MBV9677096.1 nitrate reductase [Acidobacteriaceae bacterium]